MKYVQAVVIVLLIAALAGTVGWALSERGARLSAEAARRDQTGDLKSAVAVLETRLDRNAASLEKLADSLERLEKWRNGAETRLARADRERDQPRREGLFRNLHRFAPEGFGKMMALDGKRTQTFTVKDGNGKDVTVSLMGAARVGPEIAGWMGLDAAATKKVNELIEKENRRYAGEVAAKNDGPRRHGFNFGGLGGEDGWADFVNGKEMKKLLNAEQRDQLLQKFPRRCTMHMVTTGAGDMGLRRVLIRPAPGMRGEEKEAPAPPPKAENF